MRLAWCWRCKTSVPMLDEEEYASIQEAYRAGSIKVKEARTRENRPLNEHDDEVLYDGVVARYREITGASNISGQEILHHRLSLLGPPCENCGKELRTPQAKKCVECGYVRESVSAKS